VDAKNSKPEAVPVFAVNIFLKTTERMIGFIFLDSLTAEKVFDVIPEMKDPQYLVSIISKDTVHLINSFISVDFSKYIYQLEYSARSPGYTVIEWWKDGKRPDDVRLLIK
jgi:hypothetical protein